MYSAIMCLALLITIVFFKSVTFKGRPVKMLLEKLKFFFHLFIQVASYHTQNSRNYETSHKACNFSCKLSFFPGESW